MSVILFKSLFGTKIHIGVVFINNGKCEDKINISDFKNGNSLYQAVKSKLLSNNLQEEDKEIDKKLLGCAGGYTNGRLIEL